jgi:hypothetical protein
MSLIPEVWAAIHKNNKDMNLPKISTSKSKHGLIAQVDWGDVQVS